MKQRARVVVHLPSDSEYEYAMTRSLDLAIQLHPSEGDVRKLYMAFKNIVGARNLAVADMLRDPEATHLMFIDSDQVLPELTLARLLQHDVDIVGGLYCRKLSPHTPLVFKWENEGYQWLFPQPRLIEVDAIATGCLLIKRHVFDSMQPPWFMYEPASNYRQGDKYNTTTEDITFCNKAKKAGFNLYVDGSILVGHITKAIVWPVSATQSRLQAFGQGGAQ